MIFKIMLMTRMLSLMKVYFSLLHVEWRKWMPKNVIECWLKSKNRYWIWFMRIKCSVLFFALMKVSSRCWSPFHANECVFCYGQQKVYKGHVLLSFHPQFNIPLKIIVTCWKLNYLSALQDMSLQVIEKAVKRLDKFPAETISEVSNITSTLLKGAALILDKASEDTRFSRLPKNDTQRQETDTAKVHSYVIWLIITFLPAISSIAGDE